ncbi:MAG TPA: Ig-like domain-containing protein, partial [Gemmatimonadaceae bacterium]
MRSCRYLTLCTGLLVCCVDPGKPTNPVAARIAVSPPAVELLNGASTTLHAALLSWSGDTVHDAETVVWTVRDSSLASVSSRGVVSASWALTGSTYVIARAGAFSDSVSVLVVGALPQGDPLYLWPDVSTIVPGMTRTLRLESFTTANGIRFFTGQAKWTSSDPAVASVDSTGIVTAHAVGDALITATASGQIVNANVHVMSYPAPLQFASVSLGDSFACGLTTSGD